jgi:hypothetical protein
MAHRKAVMIINRINRVILELNPEQAHEVRVALSNASLQLEHFKAQEQTDEYDSRIAIIDNLINLLPY